MSVDLLLDTNQLLWLVRGDERIAWLRDVVEDSASTVTVSSVALSEIAVKHAIGKLPDDVAKVRAAARRLGVLELDFTANHAEQLAEMPLHHRDPFDRMLIAQALSQDYVIATSDREFAQYEGLRIHGAA